MKIDEIVGTLINTLDLNEEVRLDKQRVQQEIELLLWRGRSQFLKQHVDKYQENESFFTTVEIPLELNPSNCLILGTCRYARTKIKIPRSLRSNDGLPFFSVSTPFGEGITYTQETDLMWVSQARYTGNKLRYFLQNEYVYVTSTLFLEAIKIKAIWEEPYKIQGISSCQGCGTLSDEFPFPMDMVHLLEEYVRRNYPNPLKNVEVSTQTSLPNVTDV